MAKLPSLNMNSRTGNTIRDVRGEIIAIIGMEDITVSDPIHGFQRYRQNDSIQLVCGNIFSILQNMGKDAVLHLAVCEDCRYPKKRGEQPRHGLCSKEAGQRCVRCGKFLCPSHAVKCSDSEIRCVECERKHRIKSAIRSLFFKSPEE